MDHGFTAGKSCISALVANLNQGMSRWSSRCVLQHKGQEITQRSGNTTSSTIPSLHASSCIDMELGTVICTVWSTTVWSRSSTPSGPDWYDFHIVSQAVNTGSILATHYNMQETAERLRTMWHEVFILLY